MALTTADKKWLGDKFATKDDLKNFVTKNDLKKELNKFATKDDLVVSNVRLGLEFDKKINELKDEISDKHDEVMTVLDKIVGEVVKGREHDLVINHQQEE